MCAEENFHPMCLMSAFQEEFQKSYEDYMKGVRAIVESYEIPVGQTPKKKVWSLNKAVLYRYEHTHLKYPIPLLLVYALINKPYIFDLRPHNSFVEFMLDQGFDVYLLDWGIPGLEDRNTRFDDYVTKYLSRAVRRMLRDSGATEFTMLGYCLGAVFTMLYACLYPKALRNIILLTAPLDFTGESIFAGWLDEYYFDVDRLVDTLGNIPAEWIAVASKMLKPVENYVGAYKTLWERLDDEEKVENWQALHRWAHDGVPFAGEAFRQFVKDYVRANRPIRGELMIEGTKIDFSRIEKPLLNVIAQYDHIVPMSYSTSIMEVVSSTDKQLEIVPAGHVGIMGGRGARVKLWPKITDWLKKRSGGPVE